MEDVKNVMDRMAAEREADMALIKKVNANRAKREKEMIEAKMIAERDVFIQLVANHPYTVEVTPERVTAKRKKKMVPFWYGFIFGAVAVGMLMAITEAIVKIIPVII